ncbi:hypothetical protein HYU91_03295 [Candidatus Collierbacteria bacterium]|nr:hypothetical protein [Candidatus Collierbacteria bacterium]
MAVVIIDDKVTSEQRIANLNLSTDLRRIALWMVDGDEDLAKKFVEINKKKFQRDGSKIGKKKISVWMKRIGDSQKRDWKSAEDALTLSVLLKNRFG